MIRGIIFDCFGVLCEGSLEYLVSQAPTPAVRQAVIDTNHSADYGYISHDEYIGTMAELLNLTPDDIRDIIRTRHLRNEPMFELAHSLKPAYKLGLISNVGGDVLDKLFTPDELTNVFDAVVLSWRVGIVKPNPEIYELAAARLGLAPEECLMIDDVPRNVEGAQRVGMQGLVCSSVQQVKTELGRLIEIA